MTTPRKPDETFHLKDGDVLVYRMSGMGADELRRYARAYKHPPFEGRKPNVIAVFINDKRQVAPLSDIRDADFCLVLAAVEKEAKRRAGAKHW